MHRPRFYRSPRPNFHHDPNFQPRGRFPGPHRPRYPRLEQQHYSNEEHWCETCDRAFPTVAKLEEHKQQHQKCNIDGCQFTAHPNMVTKHIQMQHATGLYKKIGKLNSPEEINKWREERKKKYPTKINVDKKAAEIKEKIERGEKMGLKQERFPNNQLNDQVKGTKGQKRNYHFGSENQHSQNNTGNNQSKKRKRKFPINNPEIDISQSENNGKLKPFAGIQQIVDFNDDVDEDEKLNDLIEDDIDNDAPVNTTEEQTTSQNICSAISMLICNYGSSDEDNLEDENKSTDKFNTNSEKNKSDLIVNEIGKSKNELATTAPNSSQIDIAKVENTTEVVDDDSGPEEVKVVRTTVNDNDSTEPSSSRKCDEIQNARPKPNPQKRKFHNVQRKPKVPSTLIYKLLHNEIKQERNIVLQCVRHIVKNNFFDQNK